MYKYRIETLVTIIFWCLVAQISMAIKNRPLLPIPTQPYIPTRTVKPIVPATTTETTTTTTTTATTRQMCPSSFNYNTDYDKCYLKASDRFNWNDANIFCIGYGARLALPKTSPERAFIASRFSGYDVWIGAKYRTINDEADYYWLDDNTTLSFCSASPFSNRERHPYVFLSANEIGCWTNWGGDRTFFVVCETAKLS